MKFRKIIREERPDIIHSWLYDANVSARFARVLVGKIPIITSLQLADYEPEAARVGNWNPNKVWLLKQMDRFSAFLADPFFVPCSEFVLQSYKKNFGIADGAYQVIYNSVDPSLLVSSREERDSLLKELCLPDDSFIYLNVGRLDPQKNHKLIFEAFSEIEPEIPNAILLLAGVGGLEKQLKALSQDLGVDEKVRFLGRRSDIGTLLEISDVFVFPSFFEGLPVALAEAMFKSLPCIASKIPVFSEIIANGESGLLVDPNSSAELKSAMLELYRSPSLRKAIGDCAFQVADAKFNSTETARQWERLYEKLSTRSRSFGQA